MSHLESPQARPSKTMSSRLMTMKFMQRAAASTPPSTPQSHPRTPDTPPSKRRKVSAAPSSTTTPPSDLQLIQAALLEEEEKRGKAIERLAEEAGETKWVLSTVNGEEGDGVKGLRVAKAGYSDTDREAWRPVMLGRRSFGKFNGDLGKGQERPAGESSSSSEKDSKASEEDDGEESDDPADAGELIRGSKEEAMKRANDGRRQRKQQRRAEKAELAGLADRRRSKEVKLNRLSSISGGGSGGGGGKTGGKQDMECYSCGEKGHAKRDCPQKGKRRTEDWHGGPAKRSRSSLDY